MNEKDKCDIYCKHFSGLPFTCWYCTRNKNRLDDSVQRAYPIKDYYEIDVADSNNKRFILSEVVKGE